MSEKPSLKPFSLAALENLARIIAGQHTGSEITELFRKAGFSEIRHDGTTKWRFVYSALEQLQQQPHGPDNVLEVIKAFCDPQAFVFAPEQHKTVIQRVNEVLKFYNLAVREDGEVVYKEDAAIRLAVQEDEEVVYKEDAAIRTQLGENARLFDERRFHPKVQEHGQQLFLGGHYFHAVLECCKAFEKYVQEKSGLQKYGADLMGAALSLKGPLKLNKQKTESERNEQEGVMHLCIGLMRAVRNPASHEPELDWPINREDALDILSLISYLFRQIDRCSG